MDGICWGRGIFFWGRSQIDKVIAHFLETKEDLFVPDIVKSNGEYIHKESRTIAQLKKHKKDLEKIAFGPNCSTEDKKRFW